MTRPPSLARYGLTDAAGQSELEAAGWWGEEGVPPSKKPILTALSKAPDPDLALRGVDRVRQAVQEWSELDTALTESPQLRARLMAVLGSSSALTDHLVAHPRHWRLLTEQPQDPTALLCHAVGARTPEDPAELTGTEATTALRGAYRDAVLQIAARDLASVIDPQMLRPSYEDITSALTELAEGALRAALCVAMAEHPRRDEQCRLAVIAMGKCGGRELNYVSDVDVVFVAEGNISLATKWASSLIRIAGNAAFEVDAALRPEGKQGALVRTLDSHVEYYKKWSRTWEFQALLKARPVAGDSELGAAYLDAVYPFIWTAGDRDNFVADVQAMRRRVEEHVPADIRERELKLGRGGLRDVEFAVQLLQLVHGRTDEDLHERSTVAALRALGAGGYVARQDSAELIESYEFLRLLEHRLQLEKMRRTHLLPAEDDRDALRRLAKAADMDPALVRGKDHASALWSLVRRHAARVRRLHEKLFYRPLLTAVSQVSTETLRLSEKQAAQRLAALGYTSPEGALRHIDALTSGVSRRAAIQSTLLPVLLELLADTPDPDGGLLSYRRMSEALADTPWYLRFLRDEGTVVERLAALLGSSKLVPDLAVRAPVALRLLADDSRLGEHDADDVAQSMRKVVARQAYLGNAIAAARSLRREELLRIASADLLRKLDTPQVCRALSSVWSSVLQAALSAVDRAEAVAQHGRQAEIAVIGMGRLGGNELGYGSDADVLFICRPLDGVDEQQAIRYGSRVAESVRKHLGAPSQDPPLQVDTDLRPEGRAGPLVRTLSSYRKYYQNWADVWEYQALTRARFIAGNATLGTEFIGMIDGLRYPAGGLTAAQQTEIRRIKARVERERLPRSAQARTNTKLGKGGLSDVEWLTQLLQLMHGHEIEGLQTPSTLDALGAAHEAQLVDEHDHDALRQAWLFATKARNAVMLVRGKASDQLPTSGRELAAVAQICGFTGTDDPGEFVDHYLRTTRHAREVFDRLFYGDN